MSNDAKLLKPMTNAQGISDPVNVFLDDGRVYVAWWDANKKMWCEMDGETYGTGVVAWSYIDFPKNWNYDPEKYGEIYEV